MTEIKISVELNMSERMQDFIASIFHLHFSDAAVSVPEVSAEATPVVDVEETTPAPVRRVKRVAKKVEPETEPEPEPEAAVEETSPAPDKKVIKLEDLRPVMSELWEHGKKEEVARILEKRGAHFLKEIGPEEYGALLSDFNAALHADD